MRVFVLVTLAAWAAGCNADCTKSADIQVTIAPNADVAVAHVAHLHVMLVVDDGAPRSLDFTPAHALGSDGSAFILRPDPAPASKYSVTLTVEAFDASNMLLAIGSESMAVTNLGCNRMTVRLAGLAGGGGTGGAGGGGSGGGSDAGMMGGGNDLSGIVPPDMAGCIGGTPDEDSDGRANSCDLCPDDADPTPSDTDGDGLPDACDPDPAMMSNKLVYFEPFDAANGHWSTPNNLISMGYLTLDSMGQNVLLSNNGSDMLPTNVRVQSHVFLKAVYTNTPFSDTGLFVGTSSNPASGMANGVLCTLHYHAGAGPDTLDLYPVSNGTLGQPTTTNVQFVSTMYRMRLTQRASGWTCEATANGLSPATVTLMKPVTGPLFVSLRSENMEAHFHAVVAETALP